MYQRYTVRVREVPGSNLGTPTRDYTASHKASRVVSNRLKLGGENADLKAFTREILGSVVPARMVDITVLFLFRLLTAHVLAIWVIPGSASLRNISSICSGEYTILLSSYHFSSESRLPARKFARMGSS